MLNPIGDHRSKYIKRSQGKRAKKRKREGAFKEPNREQETDLLSHQPNAVDTLPDHELLDYLTIGFNSTNRHLEALAQSSAPRNVIASPGLANEGIEAHADHSNDLHTSSTIKPLVAVFVPRSDQSPIMHSHLPLLIKVASLAPSSLQDIRLVVLSKGAEIKLSAALGIPRVGMVGLKEGAPAASPLIDFVRKRVSKVEIPWLTQAEAGTHIPVKINVTLTDAPIAAKEVLVMHEPTIKT